MDIRARNNALEGHRRRAKILSKNIDMVAKGLTGIIRDCRRWAISNYSLYVISC